MHPNVPAAPAKSSNKKLILIVFAVLALFLFIGFAVVAVAVGMFVYTASNESDQIPRSADKTVSNSRNAAEESERSNSPNNDRLIAKLRERSTVGEFKLQNVVPSYSNKAYLKSEGEVKGIYANGDAVKLTLISAEYSEKSKATSDFGRMIGRARASGAKMVSKITVKGKLMHAAYENGEDKTVAFCSWEVETSVICNQITSTNGDAIGRFADAMSKAARAS